MADSSNYDPAEIHKFDRLADIWWNPEGEMGTLQTINPLRVRFITEMMKAPDLKILDVGCGGGILAEALAAIGARVTGIDLSTEAIEVARQHARQSGLSIDYQTVSVEQIAKQHAGEFDLVTCMEMLEHVPDPAGIIAACARALKPGGHAFFSSINRTPKAFLFTIIGGEYILRLLPKGTHSYKMLVKPSEIRQWAQNSGLDFARCASLMYNLFTGRFRVVDDRADVNYMMHFIKAKI